MSVQLQRVLLAMLTALILGGAVAARPLPEAMVELADQRFTVEVAADDASRTRGLMFRDAMPGDRGMLFVFEREQPLAFWMKNTRIPLDILYFDGELRLVSVAADTPPCVTPYCPAYPSARPARYVLELNAGLAGRLGVKPGDRLLIINEGAKSP
jgi:uncharacterized protein